MYRLIRFFAQAATIRGTKSGSGIYFASGLPADTHCALLPVLSNSLPVIDELAKRSVRFIQNCLDSDSLVVRTMSSYGVRVGRMLSPILGGMHSFPAHASILRSTIYQS